MISTERTQIRSLFTATWLYHIICIVIKMFYIVNKTFNSGIDKTTVSNFPRYILTNSLQFTVQATHNARKKRWKNNYSITIIKRPSCLLLSAFEFLTKRSSLHKSQQIFWNRENNNIQTGKMVFFQCSKTFFL